jgi:hypothetical protein
VKEESCARVLVDWVRNSARGPYLVCFAGLFVMGFPVRLASILDVERRRGVMREHGGCFMYLRVPAESGWSDGLWAHRAQVLTDRAHTWQTGGEGRCASVHNFVSQSSMQLGSDGSPSDRFSSKVSLPVRNQTHVLRRDLLSQTKKVIRSSPREF